MKKALLIIDVQNDFLPGGALPTPEGMRLIPVINELQERFPLVVATKDWHPIDHVSFAKTHGKQVGESVKVKGKAQELWPVHCVQGSWGAEFPPLLKTQRIARIFLKGVEKGIDSYSAFFDNAHTNETGLDAYLRENHVDALFIVGLALEYCVRHTVLDALALGWEVHVIEEGCQAIADPVLSIAEMKGAGALFE